MPYSDVLPLVLPNCPEAHEEVRRDNIYDLFDVRFCDQFKPSVGRPPGPYALWKDTCDRRQLAGDRDHNWCCVCPAGYPFFSPDQETAFWGEDVNRRLKPLNLGA